MKTIVTVCVTMLFSLLCVAQNGINYKAVIKDTNGNVVANQTVGLQFTILKGVAQTHEYTETHSVMTDNYGITIAIIGEGTPSNGTYAAIIWGSDEHYLNVQVDIGAGYVNMGTTKFMSVPYALNAANISGLEALDEGNGIGWRLKGVEPDNYGNIGANAVDFGIMTFLSNTRGATGNTSFVTGVNNTASGTRSIAMGGASNATADRAIAIGNNVDASGYHSVAIGHLLSAKAGHEIVFGQNNVPYFPNSSTGWDPLDRLFVIGNGAGSSKSDAFVVLKNGTITAPDLTLPLIDASNIRVLITKEYINRILNSQDNSLYIGTDAGMENTVSSLYNVGLGPRALQNNETGQNNTAIGQNALQLSNHNSNTAIGSQALGSSTSGYENTAVGRSALGNNSNGTRNTGIGYTALSSVTTGDNNTGIGNGAQVPTATASNQVRIGNTGVTYAGVQVAWTITSDERWKEEIRDLPYGINMVTELRPVEYVRKNNEAETREIGFIAQEVREILKELNYDDQGMLTEADDGYLSLRYNDFIPVLVKAIQEQQDIIDSLQATVGSQQSVVNDLTKENQQYKADLSSLNTNLKALLSRVDAIESKPLN